jgi:putative phosphoesterase
MGRMRVAALYDIHGNLPALEAVIAEVRTEKVDQILVGGDVLPGPMPRETMDFLRTLELPTRIISGNGDRFVLEQIHGKDPVEVPKAYWPVIQWNAEQLSKEHEEWIASWPKTVSLEIDGVGNVLFCHASPRNDMDVFTKLTPEENLTLLLAEVKERVVICGHTHMQFDRRIGRTRVVNAGSVGMPFQSPGAYWLLLGPGVELRRTEYDFQAAAEQVRNSGYPQAEDFAEKNVLHTPSEEQMLAAYSKVPLKV